MMIVLFPFSVSIPQEPAPFSAKTAHANRLLHVHLHISHILSLWNSGCSTTAYYLASSFFIALFKNAFKLDSFFSENGV
jgi:hypothetical protein